MKNCRDITLIVTLTLVSIISQARAGGIEGGGGIGVLCGTSLRTLDLYEAEEIHHWPISNKYQDLDTNVAVYGTQIAVYRSDSYADPNDMRLQQELLKYINQEIVSKFSDIPIGSKLPPTNDATLPPLPINCSFVQIAVYADDGTIYRDRPLWDLLNVQNQAALILHEGIYHSAKTQGAQTSDNTRYVVGLAFSETLPEPIFNPIWNSQKKIICQTSNLISQENFKLYSVSEVRGGQVGMAIYFETFKNLFQMERLSTFIPGMNFYDFFSDSYPLIQELAEGSLFGDVWNLEIKTSYKNDYGINIRAWKNNQAPLDFSWGKCLININP